MKKSVLILLGSILLLCCSSNIKQQGRAVLSDPLFAQLNIEDSLYQELLEIEKTERAMADTFSHVFEIVEQMPMFPGGETELMRYIAKNLKYPITEEELGTQRQFTARFVVDEEGEIRDIQMIRSIHSSVDSSFVNLLEGMPKWIPGRMDGKPVAVYFTLPIFINLRE